MDQTRIFLNNLSADQKHNFCCYNKLTPGKLPRIFYNTIDEISSTLDELSQDGYDIYVTINKTTSTNRKKGDIKRIRSIWIDDDKKRESHRTDFPLPPSMITETSPGKFHYYWLTDTGNFQEFNSIMNCLVKHHGGDNGAKDISRVLRLPGYANRKSKTDYTCRLVKIPVGGEEGGEEGVRRYSWEELVGAFNVEEEPEPVEKDKVHGHTSMDYDAAIASMNSTKDQHFYEPLRSLSLSLANKHLSSIEIQRELAKILGEIPEELRTQGWETYGNSDQLTKFADSAVEIVVSERMLEEDSEDLTSAQVQQWKMQEVERGMFPFPPGLAGKLTEDFSRMTLHEGMENLCVFMTLGAIAGVSGRHVTVNNMHTHLYLAYTKTSGAGKSAGAQSIEQLYRSANNGNVDNSRRFIASPTATGPKAKMKELSDNPCSIAIVDEAGELGSMKSGEQGALRAAKLAMFSLRVGNGYGGGAYSNKDDNIPFVQDPSPSYLSISTHDSYVKFINDSNAQETGELARTLTYADKTKKGKIKRGKINKNFTDEVLERFTRLFGVGLKFQDQKEVDFIRFGIRDEHKDQSDVWTDSEVRMQYAGNIMRATAYSRAFEIALRIAALLTNFNHGDNVQKYDDNGNDELMLGDEEWQYAIKIVNKTLEELDDVFTTGVMDDLSTMFEVYLMPCVKKLLTREKDGGYKEQASKIYIDNGIISVNSLYKRVRHNPHIKNLNQNGRLGMRPGSGFDMILQEAIDVGRFREIKGKELMKIKSLTRSPNVKRLLKVTERCFD